MKPGRNDPCPCGSGRKYKHCCLPKAEAIAPEEIGWRRVRRATETLGSDLVREAAHHFGEAGLDEAWDEFNRFEGEEPFDPDSPFVTLFFSWFLCSASTKCSNVAADKACGCATCCSVPRST